MILGHDLTSVRLQPLPKKIKKLMVLKTSGDGSRLGIVQIQSAVRVHKVKVRSGGHVRCRSGRTREEAVGEA